VLRVANPQGTQSLRCQPGGGSLASQLASGCPFDYRRADPGECDGGYSFPPNPPNDWPCALTKPGKEPNAVDQAMQTRILGGANKCTQQSQENHWSDYPNIAEDDKRRITVFLTEFGALSGINGQTTIPIVSFAEFYITGWSGQSSGKVTECASNDPVPDDGNQGGYLVGHFVRAVLPGKGSDQGCNLTNTTDLRPCVAVLTQ
jgi:hypothetical protein